MLCCFFDSDYMKLSYIEYAKQQKLLSCEWDYNLFHLNDGFTLVLLKDVSPDPILIFPPFKVNAQSASCK